LLLGFQRPNLLEVLGLGQASKVQSESAEVNGFRAFNHLIRRGEGLYTQPA
jgi:hypothetical protein